LAICENIPSRDSIELRKYAKKYAQKQKVNGNLSLLRGATMQKQLYILILGYIFSFYSWAHDESNFIVELKASNVMERSILSQYISIDSIVGDRVFSVVSKSDLEALIIKTSIPIISVETLTNSSKDSYRPFLRVIDFPDPDARFHTYNEMVDDLNSLETTYPTLAQVFSIGQSVEKQDIWAIRISDDTASNSSKKAIAYMGTHHAREHVSTEIPLMLAQKLLADFETDPQTQALLKQIEIFIIPMVNPDGAMYDITGKNYHYWRKNRKPNKNGSFGIDLNRNYGYGWGTGGSSSNPSSDVFMGTAPFSEPETQSIRDFFNAHANITIALSFHTYSELILYPWGGRDQGVGGVDQQVFETMASTMASMNHYTPMQSSDLYIASGDTCDFIQEQTFLIKYFKIILTPFCI
jgi:hypothetical protein